MQHTETPAKAHSHLALWRSHLFICILLVLVLLIAGLVSNFFLQNKQISIFEELQTSMSARAQHQVAALTVWYGGMTTHMDRLTNTDFFRLFATEMDSLDKQARTFLLQKQQNKEPFLGDDKELVEHLESQLPLMRTLLQDFISKTDFLSVTLLYADLQPYLSTISTKETNKPLVLTQEQSTAAKTVVETGKRVVLPLQHTMDGKLSMDILCPIFAPQYLETDQKKAVGVMLFVCNAIGAVQMTTIPRGQERKGEASAIIQKHGKMLERASRDGTLHALPGWTLNDHGVLLLAQRSLAEVGEVYALGLPVPDLPLLVVRDVTGTVFNEQYSEFRQRVLGFAVVATLIAIMFIGMIWWWLVGRRARMVSAEMGQLYQTVNRQNALLLSMNSALSDGLVLSDKDNRVSYANKAFASIVQHDPEVLQGLSSAELFPQECAKDIAQHMAKVMATKTPMVFSLDIPAKSGNNTYYQVVCSPFWDSTSDTIAGTVSVYRDVTDISRAQERVKAMAWQTINVLTRTVEAVDPYLRGQSMHTAQLAQQLVRKMELGEEHEQTVETAATLSEIGIILVPQQIVRKQGRLTPEERSQMERHVDYARDTLAEIDFGLPVVDTIYQMHELLDGSGYPQHLQGTDISLDARILSVANTFCALVRPRSYRQAMSKEKALDILQEKPPKYDPFVVQVLDEFLQTEAGADFLKSLLQKA